MKFRFKSNRLARLFELHDIGAICLGYFTIWRLLSQAYFGDILKVSPRLKRQYMSSYLARSLPIRSRLAAVIHHHQFMKTNLKSASFCELLGAGLPLWRREFEGQEFSMILTNNGLHLYEGDLVLVMYRADVVLFQLSFSIVSGNLVGVSEHDALLIGSGQGAAPHMGEHAFAVKASGGVAPAHLIVAAVRGISHALGLKAMVGVANSDQISKTHPRGADFTFDYDQFWPMFGGKQNNWGFFEVPLAPAESPSTEKSSAHRRRSRKKAVFKAEVAAQVETSLYSHLFPLANTIPLQPSAGTPLDRPGSSTSSSNNPRVERKLAIIPQTLRAGGTGLQSKDAKNMEAGRDVMPGQKCG
jgi:uncharacterized protein VirK/YbjX